MEKSTINHSLSVIERNISLTGELMRYLFENPQILQSLPVRFEMVILPDDDPEIRLYNLELLDSWMQQDAPVVFARIKAKSFDSKNSVKACDFYAPIAA